MTRTQSIGKFFEQTYSKQLADEEVVEYKNRLVKFFSLLIEIDQRNKRKSNEAKTI
jgi:hypothetical protein